MHFPIPPYITLIACDLLPASRIYMTLQKAHAPSCPHVNVDVLADPTLRLGFLLTGDLASAFLYSLVSDFDA